MDHEKLKQSQPEHLSSSEVDSLAILDAEIAKLQKRKKNRKEFFIVGAFLIGVWILTNIYSSIDIASNPTSVSGVLGLILFPWVMIGILLFIFGFAGFVIANSDIAKAERVRGMLKADNSR